MTIKDVFIRFLLIYIVLIIAFFLFNVIVKYIGSSIPSLGIFILIGSTLYTCTSFAKKNKRYFTSEEKKQVVIGFIIINFIIEGILMVISGIAKPLSGNVLLISLGMVVIINPLIIYFFVGIVGVDAVRRY